MKMMSEGLEKLAGNRLRSILTAMTRNRFMGVVTGIVVYFNNALAYADNGAGVPEHHLAQSVNCWCRPHRQMTEMCNAKVNKRCQFNKSFEIY